MVDVACAHTLCRALTCACMHGTHAEVGALNFEGMRVDVVACPTGTASACDERMKALESEMSMRGTGSPTATDMARGFCACVQKKNDQLLRFAGTGCASLVLKCLEAGADANHTDGVRGEEIFEGRHENCRVQSCVSLYHT